MNILTPNDIKELNKKAKNYKDKNCNNCEFNVGVCSGKSELYGKPIEECQKQYPKGCEEWEMSIRTYQEL